LLACRYYLSPMSPNLRRAFHDALDLVLDAVAAEARETPPVRQRVRPAKVREMPANIDQFTIERAKAAGRKAGLL
jgi:hypothetical protein